MWLWWFVLVCDLLLPAGMAVIGWLMKKHPPKNVNSLIGYRTARSMKSPEAWQFAQEYCGRLWQTIGLALLALSLLAHLPVYGGTQEQVTTVCIIVLLVQLAVMLLSIYPTERALKKHFTAEGQRKAP